MLSERIYMFRRKEGLSQEQLAEKVGVSRQSVSKWEGGLSTPELDKLLALSECFGISMDELTKGSDEGEGENQTQEQECIQKLDEPKINRETDGKNPGLVLFVIGVVCLILVGLMIIIRPETTQQVNASSTITINGTGIVFGCCMICMVSGMLMIMKRKQ